jgi:hypothetical protein
VLIENILAYADNYSQANVAQENLKGSTKNITNDVVNSFNEIYDEIIGICKIAAAYYRYEAVKKEQFSFTKTLAKMGNSRKSTASEQVPATA